jgi:hypothetical protein
MSAVRKLKGRPRRKAFYGTLLVTRAEEWWVEAENAEEAEALLASGQGQRAALGECVAVELQTLLAESGD